jgi:exportin-7
MLLDRQDSPYSQLLATTTLTKLISRTSQVLSLQQRIDISEFLFILSSIMLSLLMFG